MGDDDRNEKDAGWSEISTTVLPEDSAQIKVPEGPEAAYLIVLSGSRMGEMFKVSGNLVIGRGEVDFQVVDDGVSRQHLAIRRLPGGEVQLRDLGSLNGTYVNDRRVEEILLSDGDKIRIGTTAILKFSYSDLLDEEFQQRMLDAAVRDPLTRLYNRRRFEEQLDLELRFVKRHQTPLALMMLDLDHFKQINDTHGHAVGDQVLVGLARLLCGAVRGEDLAARYGGEEFVLLCRGISDLAGARIAERLRGMVAAARLAPELPELVVTISAGVAALPDRRIESPEQLIEAADRALYMAKASGRNTVCVF